MNIADELERRRNLVKANVSSSFTVYQPVDELEKGGVGSGRKHSFKEVLDHPEGKQMVEGIEGLDEKNKLHKPLYEDYKKKLKEKFNYDYHHEGFEKSEDNDLEKGKRVPVGTITNGFKKVAEGKWRKVSEHGNTKEEHLAHHNNAKWAHGEMSKLGRDEKAKKYSEAMDKHKEESDKLDNTEYGDSDVEITKLDSSHKDYKPESKEQLEIDIRKQYAKQPLFNQKQKVKEAMDKYFPSK